MVASFFFFREREIETGKTMGFDVILIGGKIEFDERGLVEHECALIVGRI